MASAFYCCFGRGRGFSCLVDFVVANITILVFICRKSYTMKQLLLICFCLTITNAKSQSIQNMLQGDWLSYKIEHKDNTKWEGLPNHKNSFVVFSFKENKFGMTYSAVEAPRNVSTFSLMKNYIKTSEVSGYTIEKICADSLVLLEHYDAPDNVLRRYYFINRESAIETMQKEYIGQEKYIANQFCAPRMIKDIGLNLPPRSFRANGRLIINLKDKTVETIIDTCNVQNEKFKNSLKEYFKKTYHLWNLKKFKQFKVVEIPFYAGGKNQQNDVQMMRVAFVINTLFLGPDAPPIDNYFEGLACFKDGEYENAIEHFSKAYEEDKKNYEALYNKASLNYYIGNKTEACKDWQYLSSLGQKRADKELLEYCK